MTIATTKGNATVADYFATPYKERWELIDGVLYHTPETPGMWHQGVSGNLAYQYHCQDKDRRLGALWFGHFAVVLSERNVVEPDLMFVSRQRFHLFTDRAFEGTPDLLAEILSPEFQPDKTGRDLTVKPELYARHGIPEYWILDPILETVLALTDPVAVGGVGAYRTETLYQPEDTLTTAAIPDLSIPLAAIFAPQM